MILIGTRSSFGVEVPEQIAANEPVQSAGALKVRKHVPFAGGYIEPNRNQAKLLN